MKMRFTEVTYHTIRMVFSAIFLVAALCDDSSKYVFQMGTAVEIPCLYGEGIARNMYWYYYNRTEYVKILTNFKGSVTYGAGYDGRVSLHNDKSTLIIRNVSIADEGYYKCDVDRDNAPAVIGLISILNVFMRPDRPYLTVLECIANNQSSACELQFPPDTPFSLTCQITGFYRLPNATLQWQIPGNRVFQSTEDDVWRNDDSTLDIRFPITSNVSQATTYFCNASFLVSEKEVYSTSVMLSPKLAPSTENRTDKDLKIALPIGLVLLVIGGVLLAVYKKILHLRSSKDTPMMPLSSNGSTTTKPDTKGGDCPKSKEETTIMLLSSNGNARNKPDVDKDECKDEDKDKDVDKDECKDEDKDKNITDKEV